MGSEEAICTLEVGRRKLEAGFEFAVDVYYEICWGEIHQ